MMALVAQTINKPPAMQETCVQSLGWEDLLEKGTATHSSILAWRFPWTVQSIFIELGKAVVHVIRLANFLWLWFQPVCPLMPSLSTYCLTGVSLNLDVGYLFMAASAKHSHCCWPWVWVISSRPPLLTLDMGWLLLAAPGPRSHCLLLQYLPRWTGHGREVWQNVVHWRREWQTISIFLPWEPHEEYEYEKTKRPDTERWTSQVSRCPVCFWRSMEK